MSARSTGLALQTLVTPVITVSFALLSGIVCSQGGLWLALPVLWLVAFFVIGLEAHGVFYLCTLPIRDEHGARSGMVRFLQAFWFLQVPFSMFNGIRPPVSIGVTQGLVAVTALAFLLVSGRRNRMISAEPSAPPNVGPAAPVDNTSVTEGRHR